ncbi:hypothetical protein ACFPVX_10395 [Cohnella faecalis]|nr:hypothetical protein [Cohnella faecalis]
MGLFWFIPTYGDERHIGTIRGRRSRRERELDRVIRSEGAGGRDGR